MNRLPRWLFPALTGAVLLGGWYLTWYLLPATQKFLLPAPHAIVSAFFDSRAELLSASLVTLQGAVLGWSAAITVGFALGLLLSLTPWIRAGLYPYLMILQMTPVIVIAPVLLLWVGPGLASVTAITFLICFFPLVVNITQGLVQTDRNLVELFRLYGAKKWQEVVLLRIPAALPYVFAGLRITATLAPIGAIVGDAYAGNSGGSGAGLGFLAIVFSAQFKTAALFCTAALGCLLGWCFNLAVTALQRLCRVA